MNADYIIVGLGNPGKEYSFTRHNAGFLLLDILAQDLGSPLQLQKSLQAEFFTSDHFGGQKVLFLKPLTFMNLSGETLQRLFQKNGHLRDKPLVVVHDEADLPLGKVRIKLGGGDAGNNGLKSIRATLGHGDFYRLRIGIGKPSPDSQLDLKDHVLQTFTKAEEAPLLKVLSQGIKTLEALLSKDLLSAQAVASLEV